MVISYIMKEKRKLKTYGRYVNREIVPELRLQGKWLELLGFDPNCHVEVECKRGELIIRKIE